MKGMMENKAIVPLIVNTNYFFRWMRVVLSCAVRGFVVSY